MMRAVQLFSAMLVALAATNAARADFVYETINGGFAPGNFFWIPNDTGWYWTPSTDIELVGIQTQLRTSSNINNNITFTTTVYTDRPVIGGTILDSFTWNGTAFVDGPWLGGSFASPLSLTGGTTYFLGFSGWSAALTGPPSNPTGGAGVMMVGPTPSPNGPPTPGTTLLAGYLSTVPGQFENAYDAVSWPNTPILRFIAADPVTNTEIPEPASLALAGTGLFSLCGLALRRRRQTAA